MAIENNSFHWNPFELNTANCVWSHLNNPLSKRCIESFGGALFDVFVKNPGMMSLGNVNQLYENWENYSITKKAAGIASSFFGTLYAVGLWATTTSTILYKPVCPIVAPTVGDKGMFGGALSFTLMVGAGGSIIYCWYCGAKNAKRQRLIAESQQLIKEARDLMTEADIAMTKIEERLARTSYYSVS